jgi:serine/threonine protein phosphatase PrpC
MFQEYYTPPSSAPEKPQQTEKVPPEKIIALQQRVWSAHMKIQNIVHILGTLSSETLADLYTQQLELDKELVNRYIHRGSVLYDPNLFDSVNISEEESVIAKFERTIEALTQKSYRVAGSGGNVDARADELHRMHRFDNKKTSLETKKTKIKEAVFEHNSAMVGIASIPSKDHPNHNEDRIAQIAPDIYVVLDGMGGHDGGEIASESALRVIKKTMKNELLSKKYPDIEDVKNTVRSAIMSADGWICAYNQSQMERREKDAQERGELLSENDKKKLRIGTTVTLAVIHTTINGTKTIVTGSVGDSTAALYENGSINCLTVEDNQTLAWADGNREKASLIQTLLANSENLEIFTQKIKDNKINLNDEQLKNTFIKGHLLTQSLGHGSDNGHVIPDIRTHTLKGNEQLLLFTDGVHESGARLTLSEMEEILKKYGNPQKASEALCTDAEKITGGDRGKNDDASAMLVRLFT